MRYTCSTGEARLYFESTRTASDTRENKAVRLRSAMIDWFISFILAIARYLEGRPHENYRAVASQPLPIPAVKIYAPFMMGLSIFGIGGGSLSSSSSSSMRSAAE